MISKTYFPGQTKNLTDGPLVSVVTPFFNTAEYLEECIQSVLAQTYRNLEYVLVDNCSNDGSGQIAEKYAVLDPRIRLYREVEFLSQVENYNRALRYISPQSKYCKMVQADDWLFPECINKMVEIGERFETVGIVGAYQLQDPYVLCDGLPYHKNCYKGIEIFRQFLLKKHYVFGNPTATMLRSDIIRNRNNFYSKQSPFEDSEICFEIVQSYNFGFVHQVLTFTRTENQSITSTIKNYNPYDLLYFIIFMKYGKKYLDKTEIKICNKEISNAYLRYLGKCYLKKVSSEFWDYHLNGLQYVNIKLNRFKLLSYGLAGIFEILLNPIRMGIKLLKRN